MRFKVKLVRAVEDYSPISIDYRRRFISLLKKIFEKEFDEKSPKPYTFAVYLGKNAKIQGEYILGVESINFRFSTGDPQTAISFYNGVLKLIKENHLHNMNPKLENVYFRIVSVDIEKEKEPTGFFRTLSPVVVERATNSRNPEEKYATPRDKDFKWWLLENTQKRYRALVGEDLNVKTLEIEPISIKEEFIKHYGGYIRSFLGKFRLHTESKELLKFVYQYGLGVRTGQGFGYLETLD
jgi:CRISPR-associated endoribonuclease Cas6